jgi:uncharacterized membrane protein
MASSVALADDVAAERARLANDRILAEEERRAREAAEQAEREQVEQAQTGNRAAPAEVHSSPPVDRIEMSRALEQLRELGALKDAGYLTDEEFQLLKKKILDGAL